MVIETGFAGGGVVVSVGLAGGGVVSGAEPFGVVASPDWPGEVGGFEAGPVWCVGTAAGDRPALLSPSLQAATTDTVTANPTTPTIRRNLLIFSHHR